MTQYRVLLLLLFSLLITACSTANNRQAVFLKQTNWQLIEISNAVASVNYSQADLNKAYIVFGTEGKKVSGSDGCNRFFGAYYQDAEKLTFGMMGSTRMACPPPDISRAFYSTLDQTNEYRIEGDVLELFKNETMLLRFRAQHDN